MAITHSYVDFIAGNDAGGLGTLASPWKTLQWAFDHLARNVADGNQVNLKSSGAHVNAAALDLTTFLVGGALSTAAPLIVRGYTAAANDGGVGEVDCNGATMWAAATYDYIILTDLLMHNFGNNHGLNMDTYITLHNCNIHKGASAPNGKRLVNLGVGSRVSGCYIHDPGDGSGVCLYLASYGTFAYGNFISTGTGASATGIYQSAPLGSSVFQNIVRCGHTGTMGIYAGSSTCNILGNICYNTTAGTTQGIMANANANDISGHVMGNIVVGWSGAGGEGICAVSNVIVLGYNAFYNNTSQYTLSDQKFIDLTANDVTLAADPFTSAATGDFSLTVAAQAALRSLGWPAQYLGAHANTDANITIGPLQYGPDPGLPAVGDVRLGVVYGNGGYVGTLVAGGVTRGRILYGVP